MYVIVLQMIVRMKSIEIICHYLKWYNISFRVLKWVTFYFSVTQCNKSKPGPFTPFVCLAFGVKVVITRLFWLLLLYT